MDESLHSVLLRLLRCCQGIGQRAGATHDRKSSGMTPYVYTLTVRALLLHL